MRAERRKTPFSPRPSKAEKVSFNVERRQRGALILPPKLEGMRAVLGKEKSMHFETRPLASLGVSRDRFFATVWKEEVASRLRLPSGLCRASPALLFVLTESSVFLLEHSEENKREACLLECEKEAK